MPSSNNNSKNSHVYTQVMPSTPSPDQHPPFTLALDSPESSLHSTGGKGANLAILSRDGNFPVPPGFVVTVSAYHHFVSSSPGLLSDIKDALSKLNPEGAAAPSTGAGGGTANLEKISDAIRDAFRRKDLPKDLRSEIATRLKSTSSSDIGNVYLAVRSSATCEDMPDASFAGQHDTYLNVNPTAENVCQHVIDCFSSLFTSRAISYRENNGLDHIDAGMAVVVQEMVQSESSGVLFTANPLSGRRNESVLEAIPGLGEALVSGLVEPDRYVVSRLSDGTIFIKDTRVGAKAKVIRSVEGGGVREEEVVSDEATPLLSKESAKSNGISKTTVLNDDEVKQLILLGQEVEALFQGKPQDIEWARSADGTTYVVQSRPITTLFPLPNVPAEPLQVFFSFSAVQGISGAMFPAGQDAIRGILGGLVRFMTWGKYGRTGAFLAPVAERLYGNVTNVLSNSMGRKFLLNFLPHVEPGILAGINEVLPRVEITSGLSPFFVLRMLSIYSVIIPRAVFCLLFPDWARERLILKTEEKVREIEEKSKKVVGLEDFLNFKQQTLQTFFPSIVLLFAPRMAVAMGPLFLLTKIASNIEGGKDIVLTITRGLPHNVTTEMDLNLWQVAKTIQGDATSLAYFRKTDAAELADDFLRGKLPEAAQNTVRRFMNVYGMRGLCEIDFGRPRWREEPAPLMQTLKSYIDIDDVHAPDKVFAAGEIAAEDAIERLGRELGKPRLVPFLARRTRSIAGIRELPKFTIIRIMGILRAKMIEEGEMLAFSGVIQNPKDIFLLHDDELMAISKGEIKNCKNLIDERKAIMATEDERVRVPRVITSDGFGFYGGAVSNANVGEGANAIYGEPVSPGTYEGRIHVVDNPSQATLAPGDILCCHGTDPSWTPLFLSAGALVMEVGGLMTHGSVVAREYGIPAVVGIERATERLVTGTLVRVDGSSGSVEILEEPQDGKDEK